MRIVKEGDISLPATNSILINPTVSANNEGVLSPINTEIEEGLKTPNESETERAEVDEELIRFRKFGLADLDNINSKAHKNLKEVDLQHIYPAREQQKQQAARVSNLTQTQTKRILPHWTCINRSNHVKVLVQAEKITGKKRNIAESKDHSGLPSKRERASQNDATRPFRLVEAKIQPHQQQ